MYFILSTGRSGTTTFAKTLSLIQNSVCLHEPKPELIAESSDFRYGKISERKIRRILLKTRKPLIGNQIYGESNQCLSLIIPVLKNSFKDAQYIWLIRNGLDVVASTMQKQWYTGHSENNDKYENCSPIEKLWIDGRIRADQCGVMSTDEWNSISRFEKCCWYWSYLNEVIDSDLENHIDKEKIYTIRLEDISNKFKHLVEWLGLTSTSLPEVEVFNAAKREPYHWSKWTKEEMKVFNYWCGFYMDKFYPAWRTDTNTPRDSMIYNPKDLKKKISIESQKPNLINKILNFFS